jgi:Tfp pilus assembly protein PilN
MPQVGRQRFAKRRLKSKFFDTLAQVVPEWRTRATVSGSDGVAVVPPPPRTLQ